MSVNIKSLKIECYDEELSESQTRDRERKEAEIKEIFEHFKGLVQKSGKEHTVASTNKLSNSQLVSEPPVAAADNSKPNGTLSVASWAQEVVEPPVVVKKCGSETDKEAQVIVEESSASSFASSPAPSNDASYVQDGTTDDDLSSGTDACKEADPDDPASIKKPNKSHKSSSTLNILRAARKSCLVREARESSVESGTDEKVKSTAGASPEEEVMEVEAQRQQTTLFERTINGHFEDIASFDVNIVSDSQLKDDKSTRKNLDAKVKEALMKDGRSFVHWLFSKGLCSTRAYCVTHNNSTKCDCKLAYVASDSKNSFGGYVWQSRCCFKFYSIFKRSLFGVIVHKDLTPQVVLKLVYHWSCQTPVANVEAWVKVERKFINYMYMLFRAVCTIVLQDWKNVPGAYTQIIELAVLSLGICSLRKEQGAHVPQPNQVEFLGLYDRIKDSYRLFACHTNDQQPVNERLSQCLDPANKVVHPSATLVCDNTIDKKHLVNTVHRRFNVSHPTEDHGMSNVTNSQVTTYMKTKLPTLFQGSLSRLKLHEIQGILDELCWREKYAPTACACFDNFIEHLAGITAMEIKTDGVIPLFEDVAQHGAIDWRYNKSILDTLPSLPLPEYFTSNTTKKLVVDDSICCLSRSPVSHNNKSRSSKPSRVKTMRPMSSSTITNPPTVSASPVCRPLAPKPVTSVAATVSKQPVSEVQATFINNASDGSIPFEEYYYGRLCTEQSLGQEINTSTLHCHICNDGFAYNNVKFYSHLKLHYAKTSTLQSTHTKGCLYCTSTFLTEQQLTAHVIATHYMFSPGDIWCRICAVRFTTLIDLKQHLMTKHVKAEVPYRCQVCNFATSIYLELIDHFNRVHLASPYVMCHLCLKVMSIEFKEGTSFSKRVYGHLLKHSKKLNCGRCKLTFFDKESLERHGNEHYTCSSSARWAKFSSLKDFKNIYIKPPAVLGQNSIIDKDGVAAAGCVSLSKVVAKFSLKPSLFDSVILCLECNVHMGIYEHYKNRVQCMRCRYITNCSRGLLKHATMKHGVSAKIKQFTCEEPSFSPDQNLSCLCGYTCSSGNRMAKHLVGCSASKGTARIVMKTTLRRNHSLKALPPSQVESLAKNVFESDEEEI